MVRRRIAKRFARSYGDAIDERVDLFEPHHATTVTRLIVLPFRLLKPDPVVEFLAFGLADAIPSSLSAVETLVVRSSLVAARFGSEVPDLKRIATEADGDVVLSGTLLRAGLRLRVAVQGVSPAS